MNTLSHFFTAIFLGLFLVSLTSFAQTLPNSIPPNSNASAPIHTGPTSQTKSGTLGVGGLSVQGDTRIGVTGHLNWGTTGGANGYGLRGNAGVMEFKNSGDPAWIPFGGAASFTMKQYGYANSASYSLCGYPSLTNITCEVLGTWNQAIASGWTVETVPSAFPMIFKALPDQSPLPWKVCTFNGLDTPRDWYTAHFLIKKPDGKWYMYFSSTETGGWGGVPETVVVNCWR